MRCSIPATSRLLVGSSSNSTSGFWIRADASSSRACWPPEKLPMIRSLKVSACFSLGARFTISRTASIFGSISYVFSEKQFSKNARTVSSSSGRGIIWRDSAIVVFGWRLIEPSSALWGLLISENRVDFPAPFWPMSVSFEPRRTTKLASLRIGLVASCSYDTSLNTIIPSFRDMRITIQENARVSIVLYPNCLKHQQNNPAMLSPGCFDCFTWLRLR